jgi:hypothetical protein
MKGEEMNHEKVPKGWERGITCAFHDWHAAGGDLEMCALCGGERWADGLANDQSQQEPKP